MFSYNSRAAANIKKARLARNYTQEYVAMKLKISQNAYSKIELGVTAITIERLFCIAQILEIEGTELLKELRMSKIK